MQGREPAGSREISTRSTKHLGQPGQKYARDAKVRNGRRFIKDIQEKSTRGTRGTRKREMGEDRRGKVNV
ncbi:hypothetical protein KI387_031009 [Taxus chinensis]|uniref:Uncharacterized protein n=1 Tax=Taxus chinensis TaxID=29808 RepID=A0AA38CFJ4_TAXCH|nr:hypothetical protein KI387_031009 [Taxus chinensis]